MRRDNKVHAISAHGHVYHIEPIPECILRDRGKTFKFRWYGYKDGNRWRMFRDKRDFEAEVAWDEADPPRGPHAVAADHAEFLSTWQGNEILDKIRDQYERRKNGDQAKG